MKLRNYEIKKLKLAALFFYFLIFLFSYDLALAQDSQAAPVPQIQVEIGGFQGFEQGQGWSQSGSNLEIDWIGQYIKAIYTYGVGVAVILAVVMIMVGGFLWLTSGGSPDRVGKAKDSITAALSGLLLALFSFIILQAVNPNLISLGPLTISQPTKIEIALAPERDNGRGAAAPDRDYYTAGDARSYTQGNEGYRSCVYNDSLGNPTVGYGHLVTSADNLSVGDCISDAQGQELFNNDYNQAAQEAVAFVGGVNNWNQLTADRQTVLIDMAFNLGGTGLGSFTELQAAVLDGVNSGSSSAWEAASAEILDSVYANQVPNRARRNALIMAAGAMNALLN